MSTPRRTGVNKFIDDAMQQHNLVGLPSHNLERDSAIDNSSQGGRSKSSRDEQHNLQTRIAVGGLQQHYRPVRVARVNDDGDGLELLRSRARIRELSHAAIGGKSVSKNKTHMCLKNLPSTNYFDVTTMYSFIDDKLWSQYNIRLPKWPRYSLKPRTMCQRILRCGI